MHSLNPNKWIDNYADYLYNYAKTRVSEKEVAEDLVQETFLSAYKARENYQGRATEKTWLISILKNKVIDHYRKTLVKDPEISGRKETPISFFSQDGAWDLDHVGTDWRIDASSQLESVEFKEIFKKCVSNLKGKSLAAFQLKYIDFEESEAICKALNISPSNFWVIIHRAKLNLRNCLNKNWFDQI